MRELIYTFLNHIFKLKRFDFVAICYTPLLSFKILIYFYLIIKQKFYLKI